MDIKDLKQAEAILVEATQYEDVVNYIEREIETWDFQQFTNSLDTCKIEEEFYKLIENILQEAHDELKCEALHWIVFDNIHDIILPCIKTKFSSEDTNFFKKCKLLSDMNISGEQFGVEENYTIPLSAPIVELSVLDSYRSPAEKMNCLCGTFDLVFAEIKTAMVSVISENSEIENEIPVIDNRDIIPILMVVIIKSKLVHMFSNLHFIKSFYYKMDSKHIVCDILNSFEKAIERLVEIDVADLQPISSKIIKSIDLEEYIKITSSTKDERRPNRSLVDDANQRVLNLITRSTDDSVF